MEHRLEAIHTLAGFFLHFLAEFTGLFSVFTGLFPVFTGFFPVFAHFLAEFSGFLDIRLHFGGELVYQMQRVFVKLIQVFSHGNSIGLIVALCKGV